MATEERDKCGVRGEREREREREGEGGREGERVLRQPLGHSQRLRRRRKKASRSSLLFVLTSRADSLFTD